jgi:alkane 1-monooxygenase
MIYLFSFIVPILSFISLFAVNSILIFSPIIYAFIFIPVLDSLTFKDSKSISNNNKTDLILYSVCFVYLLSFIVFLHLSAHFEGFELVSKSLNMGISGGIIGMNCAHELGHRPKKWKQFFAKFLLSTTSYIHYFIEHNRGHHKNVATLGDPTTSKLNQTIYSFIPNAIIGSWISAYKIEKKKNGFFANKTIHYTLFQIVLLSTISVWSLNALLAFSIHSLVSIILLESVNYIEHYGIVRKYNGGRVEKVIAIHSWNSNHLFSRIHLFELSRHSDHHAMASKPFYKLESIEDSPQMPYGYSGMILMSFIPPLWFKVMNPRLTAAQRD